MAAPTPDMETEVVMANEPQSNAMETETPEVNLEGEKTAKDYYFDSYSHFGIHEEMLKDWVRTDTYRRSMVNNRHLFQGKTVLDIGCGTGILCMFAADAGAARVIGIDCADIADIAVQIVEENGFADRITILKGKVEDIELPVEKVDIIVSEWMGYFLLYESMVDTVLFARDKWLVEGGIMMPDRARIHVCGIEDSQYRREKLEYWNDVYGYKMSAIRNSALTEPLVDVVPGNQIISDHACVFDVDLYTASTADLDFQNTFEIEFNRKDWCHGLTAWFDVQFTKCHVDTGFSTAPFCDYTHWKQTVFYVDEPIMAMPGQKLQGKLKVQKHPSNHRDLVIDLETTTNYDLNQKRKYIMR